MSATIFILSALSPLLVALIRKCNWSGELVALLSLAIVTWLFTIGQWLDNTLSWPLGANYWIGLAAAWGTQQAAYKFLWPEHVMKSLEKAGNTPPPPPMPIQLDEM